MGWASYLYAFTRGLLLVAHERVRHGLATVVDSMRESIHAIRCDCMSKVHRASRSGRGKPCAIWLFRLFSVHISRTKSFQENRLIIFQAPIVRNPLVSLMGRLVACSARISVDTQTDR